MTFISIKNYIKNNPIIEIEDNYRDAIKKIKSIGDGTEYDLIILDRNLKDKTDYTYQDIAQLIPEYDQAAFNMYKTREGDFLLLLLYLQGVSCQEKVRIYSAYPTTNEALKSALYISQMVNSRAFDRENFFNRNTNGDKDRLIEQINAPHRARIAAKHYKAFSGLVKINCSKHKEKLLGILENNTTNAEPRVILEDIMVEINQRHNGFLLSTVTQYPNQKFLSDCIKELATLARLTNWPNAKLNSAPKVPGFIYTHCQTIRNFCSSYEAHASDLATERNCGLPQPTQESWFAVRHALLEILIWLDNVL